MSETEVVALNDILWITPPLEGEDGVALIITDELAARAIYDVIRSAGQRETDTGFNETADQLASAIDTAWPQEV